MVTEKRGRTNSEIASIGKSCAIGVALPEKITCQTPMIVSWAEGKTSHHKEHHFSINVEVIPVVKTHQKLSSLAFLNQTEALDTTNHSRESTKEQVS